MSSPFGELRIYDVDYLVDPSDYEVIYDGEVSKLLSSSNGTIIDVGYVRVGFSAKLYVPDPSQVITLQNNIRQSLISGSPTIVFDTVYPGNRTWNGFFQPTIVKTGTLKSGGRFGLPDSLVTQPIMVTFFSSTLEQM